MKQACFLLCVLFLATPCGAATLTPWIGAYGCYNTYAMDGINDEIEDFNETWPPQLGSMDEIDSGTGFGFSMGANLERWSLSAGYEKLPASTAVYDVLSYDLPANVFLARAAYTVPLLEGFGLRVGAGAGVVSASGSIGSSAPQPIADGEASIDAVIYGPRADISGTSTYFEGFVEGDLALSTRISLVPALGYRLAKVDADAEFSEGTTTTTIDYSGMSARFGIRFVL